jgi:hypothetical protein
VRLVRIPGESNTTFPSLSLPIGAYQEKMSPPLHMYQLDLSDNPKQISMSHPYIHAVNSPFSLKFLFV